MTNLHSDLLGKEGKNKINIDEIAMLLDGDLKLLSQLVMGELGSNSNGSYFKHPSGLLICIHYDVGNTGNTERSWNYPKEFVEPPFLFPVPTRSASGATFNVNARRSANDPLKVGIYQINNPSQVTVGAFLLAIGIGK